MEGDEEEVVTKVGRKLAMPSKKEKREVTADALRRGWGGSTRVKVIE